MIRYEEVIPQHYRRRDARARTRNIESVLAEWRDSAAILIRLLGDPEHGDPAASGDLLAVHKPLDLVGMRAFEIVLIGRRAGCRLVEEAKFRIVARGGKP